MMNNDKKIVNIVMCIFGTIAILLGFILIIYGNKLLDESDEKKSYYTLTDATIVGYKEMSDIGIDSYTAYGIIAEYEVDGRLYKIYPDSYKSPRSLLPKIGEIVQIRYNPDLPADAIWENGDTSFILIIGLIFLLTGLLFVIISILERYKNLTILNKKVGDIMGGLILVASLIIIFLFLLYFLSWTS